MAVTEESEAAVRQLRADAAERAERILNGEEPWLDEEADTQPEPDVKVPAKKEPAKPETTFSPARDEG